MSSFTQGSPLPDVTQKTTTAQNAPDYYTNLLQGVSNAGQQNVARTAQESVAGLDTLQQQGYNAIPGAATSYMPGLTAAQQTAGTAAQGITPERIQALMNPYTQNVVDEMARLSQQNMQQNIMPGLKANFVGSGSLGGQRYANALGQSAMDIQKNLTGQQYGALSQGYAQAMKGALDEATLRNQAAQTQGKLAEAEQQLGLTGAGAMTKAGAERQAYEQSLLDASMKNATNTAALLRGYNVPTTTTETFTGPKSGLYQTSDLANIMGLGGLLGGFKSGSTGDQFLNSLVSGAKTAFSNSGINWSNLLGGLSSMPAGANVNTPEDQIISGGQVTP